MGKYKLKNYIYGHFDEGSPLHVSTLISPVPKSYHLDGTDVICTG